MVPITFYKWLNMQFNSPLLALCIICITDLPFIILAGYAISIRQNDYNLLIIQYMLFGSISMNDYLAPSTLNLVNVFNSFVWANITVFYLAEVFRFYKDKSNKSYPGAETLEYLSIPERMMASPRDMVLYFHICSTIACIAIYKYLF